MSRSSTRAQVVKMNGAEIPTRVSLRGSTQVLSWSTLSSKQPVQKVWSLSQILQGSEHFISNVEISGEVWKTLLLLICSSKVASGVPTESAIGFF